MFDPCPCGAGGSVFLALVVAFLLALVINSYTGVSRFGNKL